MLTASSIIVLGLVTAYWIHAFIIGLSNKKALARIKKAEEDFHKLQMRIERNRQVAAFRLRLIHEFMGHVTESMPSYEQMLESDKPLTAANWVDVDRLIVREELEKGKLQPVEYNVIFINPN